MSERTWKIYNHTPDCYLILIIYRDFATEERYVHNKERLSEVLNDLCKNDRVCDFKVFIKVNVEPEIESNVTKG